MEQRACFMLVVAAGRIDLLLRLMTSAKRLPTAPRGTVSSVHQLRWQVLRERLSGMGAVAVRACDEETARLALCCLALLDQHEVDGKGRCRRCRTPQMWWPWTRRCSVVRTMGFHLLQPARLLAWRARAADATLRSDPAVTGGRSAEERRHGKA